MKIKITWGSGSGSTKLSAFDDALFQAGIGDFNLVELSSVIPQKCEIIIEKVNFNGENVGHKAYVVLSKVFTSSEQEIGYAGLGWINDSDNGGVFVELSAYEEEKLREDIKVSLKEMNSYRGLKSDYEHKIVKVNHEGMYSCAIVAAIYKIEKW